MTDDSDIADTSLNHLKEKMLRMNERMCTVAGEARAVDRHGYVQMFVDRFEDETAGWRQRAVQASLQENRIAG